VLLAIDTSTKYGGAALRGAGRTVASRTWRSAHNHTGELVPAVQELLDSAGVPAREVESIAVALGPGGFSTLRVGLAAAKGFALATGVPIVGIRTLEMEAYPHAERGLSVCPLLPAGRGQVAWALFRKVAGGWRQLADERLGQPRELVEAITGRVLFCGEAAPELAGFLAGRLGARAEVVADYTPEPRLEALGILGELRLGRGEADDVESLQPFYLRPPSIGRMDRPQNRQEAT